MDWGTSVKHTVTSDTTDGTTIDFLKSKVKINVSMNGIGGKVLHGASVSDIDMSGAGQVEAEEAYKIIVLSIKANGTFGEGEVKAELNLNNFLSIFDLVL